MTTPLTDTKVMEGERAMPNDKALREDVSVLLRGGRAHVGVEQAIGNWPEGLRGKKPRLAPYSPWQQLEHMRITQWDILEYIRNPQHVSPQWPDGYWPEDASPARTAWAKSVKAFQADRQALLDQHPHHIAGGKPGSVPDDIDRVIQMLQNRADCQDKDTRLQETQNPGDGLAAAHDHQHQRIGRKAVHLGL